jgi:hypothetical protein
LTVTVAVALFVESARLVAVT